MAGNSKIRDLYNKLKNEELDRQYNNMVGLLQSHALMSGETLSEQEIDETIKDINEQLYSKYKQFKELEKMIKNRDRDSSKDIKIKKYKAPYIRDKDLENERLRKINADFYAEQDKQGKINRDKFINKIKTNRAEIKNRTEAKHAYKKQQEEIELKQKQEEKQIFKSKLLSNIDNIRERKKDKQAYKKQQEEIELKRQEEIELKQKQEEKQIFKNKLLSNIDNIRERKKDKFNKAVEQNRNEQAKYVEDIEKEKRQKLIDKINANIKESRKNKLNNKNKKVNKPDGKRELRKMGEYYKEQEKPLGEKLFSKIINTNTGQNLFNLSNKFKDLGSVVTILGGKFKPLLAVVGTLTGVITGAVKACIEFTKACVDAIRSLRETSSKKYASGGTENILDKQTKSLNKQLDILGARFRNIGDALKYIVTLGTNTKSALGLLTTGLSDFFNKCSEYANFLYEKTGIEYFNFADKVANKAGELAGSPYSLEERREIRENAKATALGQGLSERDATIQSNRFMKNIDKAYKDTGANPTQLQEAMYNAQYNGDYSGLQALGFGIDENNMRAWLHGKGIDTSGNTTYMDGYLSSLRGEGLNELLGMTAEQLAEMRKHGVILGQINQSFDWEDVEALSSVNTSDAHYDANGNLIVNNSDANDGSSREIAEELKQEIRQLNVNLFHQKDTGLIKEIESGHTLSPALQDKIKSLNDGLQTLWNNSSNRNETGIEITVKTNEKFDVEIENKVKDAVYESAQNFTNNNNSTGNISGVPFFNIGGL